MQVIGLLLLAAAIAMLVIARPHNGIVVDWLATESRQQYYGFTFVVLLAVGLFMSLN
jgi:hypothetical protein